MLDPEMFTYHGMFMFFHALVEVAASVTSIIYKYRSHVNSYTTLCWFIREGFSFVTLS